LRLGGQDWEKNDAREQSSERSTGFSSQRVGKSVKGKEGRGESNRSAQATGEGGAITTAKNDNLA